MAKKKQGVRRSVGTASGLAGVVVGAAAAAGKKIIVGGGKGIAGIGKTIFSVGRKNKVKVPTETIKASEQSEGEESELFSLESVPQHNVDTETQTKELEFKLADAQKGLDQARHKAMEAQSHLASQLSIIQREMMSPLSNLKNMQVRRPPNPALQHNADAETQSRKLESELSEEQEAHAHLMSQLNTMQKERTSIIEDLNDAKDEADTAKDRICAIESELDETQCRLEKIREQPDETASSPHESFAFHEVTSDDVRNALFAIESEKEIVQRAMSDITNENEETRTEAAAALGSVHHDLAVRVLANRLTKEPSARVRADYVGALTDLGMKKGLPAVERALTDQEACVRLAAVKGVYRLAGTESIPMLVNALSDENDSVRYRAGVLAGWLGRKDLTVKMQKLMVNQNLY